MADSADGSDRRIGITAATSVSPVEKKSSIVGIRREQVINNDPLLDPLSNQNLEAAHYDDVEVPKFNINTRVGPLELPIPPSAPANLPAPVYEPAVRHPLDKIDQMAEAFIRTCRYVSSGIV